MFYFRVEHLLCCLGNVAKCCSTVVPCVVSLLLLHEKVSLLFSSCHHIIPRCCVTGTEWLMPRRGFVTPSWIARTLRSGVGCCHMMIQATSRLVSWSVSRRQKRRFSSSPRRRKMEPRMGLCLFPMFRLELVTDQHQMEVLG